MILFQIDSLKGLKNNTGFWDNFVWPLAVLIIVGLYQMIKRFISAVKSKKVESARASNEETLFASSYSDVCQRLVPWLNENKYIFETFGPNSSAHNEEPLRTDMALWHASRIEYILPNNEKIKTLIETNAHLIPHQYRSIFQSLLKHIFAFKSHVENPNFSYAEHQFPANIEEIVKGECFSNILKDDLFLELIEWLHDKTKLEGISEASLFGSTVFSTKYNKDVDLVMLLTLTDSNDIIIFNDEFGKLKEKFEMRFQKPLHTTIFTGSERGRYNSFLAVNNYKYIL